ncbi:MAG TPA: hypothetical protein VK943_07715 [Arenibaculum sp.]|nr:hypothetical protein [Arenibaculum sp.]
MCRNKPSIPSPSSPGRLRSALVRILAVALAAGTLAAGQPATAAPACYSSSEFEAEQALRLHTELMMVGLTCHRLDLSQDFFGKYQQFTTMHRRELMDYEGRLVGHFRRNEKGNGEKLFHTFRTEMANEVAQRAALLTVGSYCRTARTLVDGVMAMSAEDLKRVLAEAGGPGYLASRPPCDAVTPVAGPVRTVAGTGR